MTLAPAEHIGAAGASGGPFGESGLPPPNPRVQRTRPFASLRGSPLTRHPLGRRRFFCRRHLRYSDPTEAGKKLSPLPTLEGT